MKVLQESGKAVGAVDRINREDIIETFEIFKKEILSKISYKEYAFLGSSSPDNSKESKGDLDIGLDIEDGTTYDDVLKIAEESGYAYKGMKGLSLVSIAYPQYHKGLRTDKLVQIDLMLAINQTLNWMKTAFYSSDPVNSKYPSLYNKFALLYIIRLATYRVEDEDTISYYIVDNNKGAVRKARSTTQKSKRWNISGYTNWAGLEKVISASPNFLGTNFKMESILHSLEQTLEVARDNFNKEQYQELTSFLIFFYNKKGWEIPEELNKLSEASIAGHISHPEQGLFSSGSIADILELFEHFLDDAQVGEKISTTVKIDGSPALLMWSKIGNAQGPAICTRQGLHKKEPLYFTTKEQIEEKYNGLDEMIRIMSKALDVCKNMHIKPDTILKGDYLFDSTSKEYGETTIEFTPNTLTYSVDKENNPKLYKEIDNADFGLVLHTKMTGSTIEEARNNVSSELDESLYTTPDKTYIAPTKVLQVGGLGFTPEDNTAFKMNLDTIRKEFGNIRYLLQDITKAKSYGAFFELITNKLVRNGFFTNNNEYDINVMDTIESRIEDKLPSKAIVKIVETNKDEIITLYDVFLRAIFENKTMIIDYMNTLAEVNYFVHKYKGKRTTGEGFVLAYNGELIKLVDRPTFSYRNFQH